MRPALVVLAIALLAACGRPQIAPAPADPFGPLPAVVYSAMGPVRVFLVDSIVGANPEYGQAWAGFDARNRRIVIRRDIRDPVQAWATLEHEKCHVWMFDAGIRVGPPDLMEFLEWVCNAYAAWRVGERYAEAKRR